jgi:hypothetical protein
MTVKTGYLALSVLALLSLVMLVGSPDEAYRWVEQSGPSAVTTIVVAGLGFAAAYTRLAVLGFAAAGICLVAAAVQFVGLADGGLLGGNGSTFAFLLALTIGYAGLALAPADRQAA